MTIHKDGCSQIKKRGGIHKYEQGEYRSHDSYQQAYAFAGKANLPIKNCQFCNPIEEIAASSCQYWLEQNWPSANRNLSDLYVWFHEKKKHKNDVIKDGDRILFYEVRRHPSKGTKGSKTVFASGTVTNETIYIPTDEQWKGGKRWLFKRKVITDYVVPPEKGIPLSELKVIRAKKGWPQSGFQIDDPKEFGEIERRLRERQEKHSQEISSNRDNRSAFKIKTSKQFRVKGKESNESNRLAALEKSANAHKDLLNKLYQVIQVHNCETSENQQVDLFSTINGASWIFEVKSTNDDNFLCQIRNGIAQLYEYRFLYSPKDKSVNLCLVVLTPPPAGLEWITEYLKVLNIFLCWSTPNGFYTTHCPQLEFLSNN